MRGRGEYALQSITPFKRVITYYTRTHTRTHIYNIHTHTHIHTLCGPLFIP